MKKFDAAPALCYYLVCGAGLKTGLFVYGLLKLH